MPEFAGWYSPLKSAHIGLVLLSGGLFALRGALVLAAGVTLWVLLSLNPVASPWLGAKLLLLLVLYIVLGSLALKRAKAPAARRASYAGALMVYMFMASVALSHHPLGLLQPWWTHGG